jgi:hypothetical protein
LAVGSNDNAEKQVTAACVIYDNGQSEARPFQVQWMDNYKKGILRFLEK